MTRRLRVRPFAFQVFAAALVAVVAPGQALGADEGQQYQEPPYRDELPVDENTDWSDRIPAHVSTVDGVVELERDGQREAAEENVPLLAGDRLRTARGRAEVLFSDGSALALDQNTDVDLLSDSLIRVQAGRIRIAIARGGSDLDYRVDTAGTTTWLRSAGEYRIAVDNRTAEPDVYVAVLRGNAELEAGGGRTLIRTGFEARANARLEPSLPYATNVSAVDAFDRWVDDQQSYRSGARSAQYLPAELRYYGGAFDQYGAWNYEPGYGYVWFPSVAADWRPYYQGGWSFYASFGWTWIGAGRWTWPTHHYGRWGYRSNRWFWIPGRRWAPAWVSWASAPGYYGWCPLGFDNRPIVAITNINVYGGNRWRGWTIVPANRFGPRVAVSRWAVPPGTVASARFAVHTRAPVRPTSFAARQVEPLRAPTYASTRYAVPRSSRASSPAGSVVTRPTTPGEADGRSGVARSRVSSSPERPSNPVTRPAGPQEALSERPSSVRTASPRSRSTPAPGAAPSSGSSPRSGSSSGSGSSGGASSGRATGRRSISSAPAPLPSERIFGRRPGASSADSPNVIQRRSAAPRNMNSRFPTPGTRSTPVFERSSRIERSLPSRSIERPSSRAVRSAPERVAPAVRSAPSRTSRAQPGASSGSSPRSSGGSGQARGRNR